MDFLGILFGIILLSQGGDLLTKSSVDISLKLSIPKIIIGMTIVSFATSAPELIVSLNATLDGLPNFAIGNVLGSNIANIGLVLGIITIIYPITLKQRFYKTDFPLLLISTVDPTENVEVLVTTSTLEMLPVLISSTIKVVLSPFLAIPVVLNLVDDFGTSL